MDGGPVDIFRTAGGDGGVEFELGNGSGGVELMKKKRGRPPRAQAKSPPTKMNKEEDEDVCFICFDGGSLVLCNRQGCLKAYHPACVKRDEAFFQSKNKWNCGMLSDTLSLELAQFAGKVKGRGGGTTEII
ncbi:hypothetical protein L2E82_44074 [Cichorium intybus]|uniref:Uncharacterized protein n=1 Tax=Cichorium intybus TaxID=13427 RepID=A0ACB8ZPS3_CICIN|nr:hypothetical protein L2E82_44074 [Cichorium intybus]